MARGVESVAQVKPHFFRQSLSHVNSTLIPTGVFIENVGQYGKSMEGYENMGLIRFGYEGFGMPVLFTPKGLIHLQRRSEKISRDEEERMEKQGIPE